MSGVKIKLYFDIYTLFNYNIFMNNKLMTKQIKYFNPLNDYFIRYLFTCKGSSERPHFRLNLVIYSTSKT